MGGAAGDEITDNYVKVLSTTGVKGHPFVEDLSAGEAGTDPAGQEIRASVETSLIVWRCLVDGRKVVR